MDQGNEVNETGRFDTAETKRAFVEKYSRFGVALYEDALLTVNSSQSHGDAHPATCYRRYYSVAGRGEFTEAAEITIRSGQVATIGIHGEKIRFGSEIHTSYPQRYLSFPVEPINEHQFSVSVDNNVHQRIHISYFLYEGELLAPYISFIDGVESINPYRLFLNYGDLITVEELVNQLGKDSRTVITDQGAFTISLSGDSIHLTRKLNDEVVDDLTVPLSMSREEISEHMNNEYNLPKKLLLSPETDDFSLDNWRYVDWFSEFGISYTHYDTNPGEFKNFQQKAPDSV